MMMPAVKGRKASPASRAGEAEHALEEERVEEEHREQPHGDDEHRYVGAADGTDREDREPDERLGGALLDDDEPDEEDGGEGKDAEHLPRPPPDSAERTIP